MADTNPIFEKNLECIGKYNSKLKDKLTAMSELTQQFELVETELGEANLSFNCKPLHSQKGAEAEAKTLFQKRFDSKLSMHIIFGWG